VLNPWHAPLAVRQASGDGYTGPDHVTARLLRARRSAVRAVWATPSGLRRVDQQDKEISFP
jgi:hypothetical protein